MGSPDWTQLCLGSRRGNWESRSDVIEKFYDSLVSATAAMRVLTLLFCNLDEVS